MSRAQAYRPRFVDIRIRPPEDDVEPDARRCDWADCVGEGTCRAPKGPERLRDFYWFCPRHAAEYNKSWNFFTDMTEAEVRAYQAASATGHRPTWNTKTHTSARARANAQAHAARAAASGRFFDPFDMLGDHARAHVETPRRPELGKLEARAYEALGFDGRAPAEDVRSRYAELVKRYHPDANAGDRSSEGRLQQVIQAYKTLRRAGMA
ncbi:MAG: DnaJ domain-containing protein [Maricaulaceae bacterium]|jgi:curved DNA-binding protein CbpA